MSGARSRGPTAGSGRQPPVSCPGQTVGPLPDEALYEENVVPLYAFIYSKVGQREAAEDLTADVFVKAFPLVDHTKSRESIRSWLYQIARTTVADYWRALLRTRVISLEEVHDGLGEPQDADAGAAPPPCAVAARARALLVQLPPTYRAVLTLRFLRGYSLRATAEALGLSEANVKVVQHRACHKVRALAGEEAVDGR